MTLKVIFLLFVSAVFCQNLPEGDRCNKDGADGVCLKLGQCRTALVEISRNKRPQICSFDNSNSNVPIVCCVDETPNRPPPLSPPSSPPPTPSPPIVPSLPSNNEHKCGPIPARLSPPKTGKKAYDKCIDYQRKYVYPCDRGTALSGAYSIQNNCHHKTDSLIIGGTDAEEYEFPHMALLGYGDLNDIEWDCGGSIVSERFIITAAHCTYRKLNDPVTHVAIGALSRSDTKDTSKIYKVKNIHKHPEYSSPSTYNDIALIETERVIDTTDFHSAWSGQEGNPIRMELSQYIVPACLHTGDDVDDDQVLATGWGNTQGDGSHASEILQRVVISKFLTKQCSRIYRPSRYMKKGFNEQTQSCYGDRDAPQLYESRFTQEHKDTCQGDSGGPIQIKDQKISCMYTIVGLVSIGKPKCGQYPAIYTRVAHYLPWIEDTVWPN